MNQLPVDVLSRILSYLSVHEIVRLGMTSRSFHAACRKALAAVEEHQFRFFSPVKKPQKVGKLTEKEKAAEIAENTMAFCSKLEKMSLVLSNLKALTINSFFLRLDVRKIRRVLIALHKRLPSLKELILPTPILANIEFYEAHVDFEEDTKKKQNAAKALTAPAGPPQKEEESFMELMKLVTVINFQFYFSTTKPASFGYVASLCPNVAFIELSSCKIRHPIPFQANLISLKFFNCKFLIPPEVEVLDGRLSPHLEEFNIENCTGFRGAWLSSLVHCRQLAIIRLSRLALPNAFLDNGTFPQLVSLSFGWDVTGNDLKVGQFIRRHLSQLTTLEIGVPTATLARGILSEGVAPLPCNLDILHLGCFPEKEEPLPVDSQQLDEVLKLFARVRKLQIFNFEKVTTVMTSAPLFQTLEELVLEYVALEAHEVSSLLSRSPALLSLQIDYLEETTDRKLVVSSNSLRKLDVPVETCSVVVLQTCPSLEELNIYDENGLPFHYIQAKGPLPCLQKIDLSFIPFARDFWRNTLPSLIKYGPSIIHINLSRVPSELLSLLRRDKVAYLFFWNAEPFVKTLKTRSLICSIVLDTLSKHPEWRFELAPKGSSAERKVYKINQPGHMRGYMETNFPEFFIGEVDESKIPQMSVADFQAFAVKFTEPILNRLFPLHRILFITAEDSEKHACPFV